MGVGGRLKRGGIRILIANYHCCIADANATL